MGGPRLHYKLFIVTCVDFCTGLTSGNGTTVVQAPLPALFCYHEEPDTQLLLHAVHTARSALATVVI